MNYLSSFVFVAGVWDLANGILHDVFVLRSEHGRKYDRTLLRLLMDGHILMTCGGILIICSSALRSVNAYGYFVAGVALVSIVVYCALIFPFLKSIVTLLINSITLIILIISFIKK